MELEFRRVCDEDVYFLEGRPVYQKDVVELQTEGDWVKGYFQWTAESTGLPTLLIDDNVSIDIQKHFKLRWPTVANASLDRSVVTIINGALLKPVIDTQNHNEINVWWYGLFGRVRETTERFWIEKRLKKASEPGEYYEDFDEVGYSSKDQNGTAEGSIGFLIHALRQRAKEIDDPSIGKPIHAEVFGDSISDVYRSHTGIEGQAYSDLFQQKIHFMAESDITPREIVACVNAMNKMPRPVIDQLCEASIRYCNDFLDDIGEELRHFERSRDVLNLITPGGLIVPSSRPGREPPIHLSLDCDWEEEHGLEWLVRDDTVLYVGDCNGNDPWGDFSEQKRCGYA